MTYIGDIGHTCLFDSTFLPHAALTSNTNGLGVDMILGDANNCNALIEYGVYNVGTADEVYTITITESDDNTTFVALATPVSFVLSAPAGALGTQGEQALIVKRSKRYLRAELTVAGTGPSILLAVQFLEKLKISGSGGGYQP